MRLVKEKGHCNMSDRMIKGISFTNDYIEEYRKLSSESNSSQLVCELLKNHYDDDIYTSRDIKRDMTHIKLILSDIMQVLEVSKYGK
ncbi:MAG: hypothetical protein ACRCX8_08260 [Sarcina sp.]